MVASVLDDITGNLPRGATGWLTLAGIAVGFVLLWLVLRRLVPSRLLRWAVIAVPVVALAWWVAAPVFVDERVDEALPQAVAADSDTTATSGGSAQAAAPAAPEPVKAGTFAGIGHRATGRAAVYELGGGERVLRLEEVDIQNGPDLYVYLVPKAGQEDDDGALSLGRLKGNQGNQNYDLPAGTDLGRFRTVLIWCKQFSVPFGNATLS